MVEMIDWFSGLIGYDAQELKLGRVLVVDRQGNVEQSRERWEKAVGSYASSVQVRSALSTRRMRLRAGQGLLSVPDTVLQVSGNPLKYLQGHNVAGVSVRELVSVLRDMSRQLKDALEIPDSVSVDLPAVHASRVDITVMVELGSHEAVHRWLSAAETMTRSRHGRPLVSGDTVYWGQHSTRWSLKAYCKHCELEAHPVADLEINRKLREYAESQLRLELTLRRPELKHREISDLDEGLVWEYFERITIGVVNMEKVTKAWMEVESVTTRGLPYPVRMALHRWFQGIDVRREVGSKPTFYRYRRIILEVVGVDISLPCKLEQEQIDKLQFSLEFLQQHTVLAKDIPDWLREIMYQPSDV